MKRIVLLVMCCMVFSVAVCNAEIFTSNDDFTGGKIIGSHFYCNDEMKYKLDQTSFRKIKSNLTDYIFGIYVRTFKEYSISYQEVLVNVDSGDTFAIDVLRRDCHYSDGYYISDVDYNISQEIIDKLKTANRVALKFTQNNGNQFVYVLPDEVLVEWKQVIDMDK